MMLVTLTFYDGARLRRVTTRHPGICARNDALKLDDGRVLTVTTVVVDNHHQTALGTGVLS